MTLERNLEQEINEKNEELQAVEVEISKLRISKIVKLPKKEAISLRERLNHIKENECYLLWTEKNQQLTRIECALAYCNYVRKLYVIKEKSLNLLYKNKTDHAIQEYEKYLELPAIEVNLLVLQKLQSQLGSINWHKSQSIEMAFNEINEHYSSRMNEQLLKLGWPEVNGQIDNEFITLFLDYTKLHCPSVASFSKIDTTDGMGHELLTDTIASFDSMAFYHKLAFKSHFKGKKKTNQLDKPELYLDYLLGVFRKVSGFLNNVIQLILDESEFKISAMHEFISSCLTVVQEKLLNDIPKLLQKDRPDLVANTIINLLKFDDSLKSTYNYSRPGFKGTAGILLGNNVYRKSWLDYESESILESYFSVVDPLNYLENVQFSTFTTKSAQDVGQLFEHDISYSSFNLGIYSNLDREYVSEYFRAVHSPIFINYYEKLAQLLETFNQNYYPVSKKPYSQTPKYADIKLLISGLNSLIFINEKFKLWSEEDWYIAINLSLFDELISRYRSLIDNCSESITRDLLAELKSSYYPYKGKKDFASDVITVSNEFLGCISTAGEILELLNLLCPEMRVQTLKSVLEEFDEYVVLNCSGLTITGNELVLQQIQRDFLAFWKVLGVSGVTTPQLNNLLK